MPNVKGGLKSSTFANVTKPDRPAKRKLRHSNIHLTINTNRAYRDPDSDEFKRAVAEFLRVANGIINETRLNTPGDLIYLTPEAVKAGQTWDDVKEIEFEGRPELGGERRMLHMHLAIFVSHYTNIRFSIDKMRAEFKAGLGDGINLSYRMHADARAALINYINKAA